MSNKGQFTSDRQPPNRGGRKRGTPNKTTTQLKEAILAAAERAGGEGGLVKYLHDQARLNPGHFMTLLGKVLPMQVAGDKDNPLQTRATVEWTIVGATSKKDGEQDNHGNT
jgi:hypothetical protein